MGMIAAVQSLNPALPPCVVKWVGKVGFASVGVQTYCNQTRPTDKGVMQIPDDAAICGGCEAAIATVPRKPK